MGYHRKPVTKEMVERAMRAPKSNKAAARYLSVSYIHYKKWAKTYFDNSNGDERDLFEQHKNQSGKGIPKFLTNNKKNDFNVIDIIEGRISSTHFNPDKIKYRMIEQGFLSEKCNRCGHLFNVFTDEDKRNLKKYYEIEHTKNTKTTASKRTLNVGINDACSLPFEDNSFDVVVLDHVLEHLIDLKSAMKEIKRVLDKGGLCHINVPDAERYNDIYWYIMREHIQHFKLSNLKLLAQNTGFELVSYIKNEFEMLGTLHLPNLSVVLKPRGKIYCWGIGREFMYLYPKTRLKDLDIILVDDTPKKQRQTFKGMKIYGSDILKDSKNSFLIIMATGYKDILKKKAKEIGYKGDIIDI